MSLLSGDKHATYRQNQPHFIKCLAHLPPDLISFQWQHRKRIPGYIFVCLTHDTRLPGWNWGKEDGRFLGQNASVLSAHRCRRGPWLVSEEFGSWWFCLRFERKRKNECFCLVNLWPIDVDKDFSFLCWETSKMFRDLRSVHWIPVSLALNQVQYTRFSCTVLSTA